MNLRQILLAEDDPLDAKLTLGALESKLAEKILVVSDGEEVLDYLYRRGRFDKREAGNPLALLLDLKMPKIDGLSALKTIKQDPRLRTTPVIILSSSRETSDLLQCYENGAECVCGQAIGFCGVRIHGRADGRFLGSRQRAAADQ